MNVSQFLYAPQCRVKQRKEYCSNMLVSHSLKPIRQRQQLLSNATKKKRHERSWELLHLVSCEDSPLVIWTDEELCNSKEAFNSQNDRVIANDDLSSVPKAFKTIPMRQKSASIMVWSAVADSGEKSPIFFTEQGSPDLLESKVKACIDGTSSGRPCLFQQDGAHTHKAKKVQAWCTESLEGFVPKTLGPLSFPDLNIMDFVMWGILILPVKAPRQSGQRWQWWARMISPPVWCNQAALKPSQEEASLCCSGSWKPCGIKFCVVNLENRQNFELTQYFLSYCFTCAQVFVPTL